jgi:hypothetical protein
MTSTNLTDWTVLGYVKVGNNEFGPAGLLYEHGLFFAEENLSGGSSDTFMSTDCLDWTPTSGLPGFPYALTQVRQPEG